MHTKKNIGTGDRIFRATFGVMFLGIGIFKTVSYPWRIFSATLGLVLVLTAAAGYCLVYNLFGISTNRKFLESSEEPIPPDKNKV